MPAFRRPAVALFVTLLAAAALAGCASDAPAPVTVGPASSAAEPCALTVADQWVKAAESGMTAVFATIGNPGSTDEVVVSASSPAAGRMEIHEVVEKDGAMVMQPKEGGLAIPAGGSARLLPGGDHLMMVQIPEPIEAGDEVEVTLGCGSGARVVFTAVAKPFEGAAESYQPGVMGSQSPSPSAS